MASKPRVPSPARPVPLPAPPPKPYFDPHDLAVLEGAERSIEAFLALEDARDAHLKLRVGFDLVPPSGIERAFKSTANLTVDVAALHNLPRARCNVLKRHEEEKKNSSSAEEIQDKCPVPTRSDTTSSRSDRTRQSAGGDDVSQSSAASSTTRHTTTTTASTSLYEAAKSALSDALMMGPPFNPVAWPKVPKEEQSSLVGGEAAVRRASSAAVCTARKGCTTEPSTTVTSSRSTMSLPLSSLSPSEVFSPAVQRRIEMDEERENEEEARERREKKMNDKERDANNNVPTARADSTESKREISSSLSVSHTSLQSAAATSSELPYPAHQAARRALSSAETFAVKSALQPPLPPSSVKQREERVHRLLPHGEDNDEEVSDEEDTESEREDEIGLRDARSTQRLSDEDTLNNVKSIEEDESLTTKRTESDTSVVSDVPAYPEASFDFRRVDEKRVEVSFQVRVRDTFLLAPPTPSRPLSFTPSMDSAH